MWYGFRREETIARLRRALDEYTVTGIKTNAGLFRRILTEPDFLRGEIHTTWLDQLLTRKKHLAAQESGAAEAAAIAAALWQYPQSQKNSAPLSAEAPSSRWKQEARRDQLDRTP